ncbi:hypothetical protein E4U13_003137 [Claviceps humidiphila]|uniref:FAD-binding domain-containing protein n=1 Tax=Claviceps humidiphila TaxID=1294629 RepID=A0A9P7Q062_9HYPO|nr:hypothetical protein E4U13_003137 [Claviceps humidiphila]
MSNQKPLKILIAGAGIAGPSLAFWLQRLGHSVTIIERWSSLRIGGQQIDIRDQGIEAIERMGIIQDVREHVVDEAGVDIVDHNGKSIIFFPRYEAGGKHQAVSSEYEIMRGDLCHILYDRTKDKVVYKFGLSVQGFEDKGHAVSVTLSDGSTADCDLLVGADGQNSRIRRALNKDMGGDEQFIQSTGVFTCYYSIKREAEDKNRATCCFETGQRCIMTRWHSPRLGQVYLMTMAPGHQAEMKEALTKDVEAQKDVFRDMFRTAGYKQTSRLLDAMKTTDDFYANEVVHVLDNAWSKGRVVLLGDAAFCPSSMSGMGTSAAMVGAYILAGEIARCSGGDCEVEAALARYSATLHPYIDKIPKPIPGLAWMIPQSATGLKALNFALGLPNKCNLPKLIQWFTAPGKDEWVMPWYQELHVGEEAVSVVK